MIFFILLTFFAYLSIDFSVYWLGSKEAVDFSEIFFHHLKMLPVYLIGNILLTTGFVYASGKEFNPMLLFSLSILIWVVSLVIVSMVLYKTFPGWLTGVGLLLVLGGVVLIQMSIKH